MADIKDPENTIIMTLTGGEVSGYNIDQNQIENAVDWAAECGMSDSLHFKIGDHHNPLEYESETFDGCFSFQAVWPCRGWGHFR